MWFSHLGVHRCTYGEVNDEGVSEKSWEPDYSFEFTLPDHDVRKEILIEAKTGGSPLKRNQAEVMELVAQETDTEVFLCNVSLGDGTANLSYERTTP
jgi:hypothetical protein